jgi:hypothetical protein
MAHACCGERAFIAACVTFIIYHLRYLEGKKLSSILAGIDPFNRTLNQQQS